MKTRRYFLCLFLAGSGMVVGTQAVRAQNTSAPTTTTGSSTTQTTTNFPTNTNQSSTSTSTTSSNSQEAQTYKVQPAFPISATSSGTGSATTTPSNSNPFVSWYGDPLSMGLPSKWLNGAPTKPSATFAKGIYTTTTNSAGGGTANTANNTQAAGFSTVGTPRAPQYATVLSSDFPIKVHTTAAVQSDVRGLIDRSSYVKNKGAIQVNVVGKMVALTGQVGTEKERRIVEAMARMTPGVHDVQNELTIAGTK